jgi:hypothetical protein
MAQMDTGYEQVRCVGCGNVVASYDVISSLEGGYRQLCTKCFNGKFAQAQGLAAFAHVNLEPVVLTDAAGLVHQFHFRTRLFGDGVAMDAFELRDGQPAGYEFQMIGDAEDDLLVLLCRLIEKMRRALSTIHVLDGELGLQIADQQVVRGRIEWDEDHDGEVPVLIIDGKEITWRELGRMLMSYEGWQFKLSIHDKSDEV